MDVKMDNGTLNPETLSTVTIAGGASGSTAAGRSAARSPMQRLRDETVFVLAAWPLSLAAFCLVPLVIAAIPMTIMFFGFFVLWLVTFLIRGLAIAQRQFLRRFLRVPAPTPRYQHADPVGLKPIFARLKDPQTWLDVLWAFVCFILATPAWTIVIVWWSAAVGGVTWPLWGWTLPGGPDSSDLPELLGLGESYLIRSVFYVLLGLVCVITLPWVVRGCAWLIGGPSVLLLSGRAELQAELDQQVAGRQAARSAEAGSLRRLERDIHDGPQQRLVRLGMDLGRARKQVDDDPQLARNTLDEAITQTRETLDELRALSRGIAPPVLTDRGLTAALQELVARSTIPVHLTVDVDGDLPEHVETAAYFVVSEALTNVAKHALATYAIVTLQREGKTVSITVQDNGVGGAQLSKGHGLIGLSDRVRGVDGVLNISSPAGGPTELTAELPCGS